MKNLLPILLLPLFVFIACGDDDDDDDICIDLKADLDASAVVYNADGGFTSTNCNEFYDDVLALINEGCDEELLSGTGGMFENWTADSVAYYKSNVCANLP